MLSAISWVLGGLILTIGLLGLGFFLLPSPFKVDEASMQESQTLDVDLASLPEPVQRYVEQITKKIPNTDTAVMWGRGRIRNGGLWLPIRYKTYMDNNNGPEMSRYTEVTWYSVPLLRSIDYYIQGEGALIGAGLAELRDEGPMATQAEYTSMWAQMVTMPSFFLTTPGLTWQSVDANTASVTLPELNGEQDTLTFEFAESGLVASIHTFRYRVEDGVRAPWRVEFSNWKTFDQILLPTRHTFIWKDTGPYVTFGLEGMTYNINPANHMSKQLP